MIKVRFITGIVLFIALVAIHVWIKDLPTWLIAMPGALWGVDIAAALGWKK